MLTGSLDNTARVWDLMTGKIIHTYFKDSAVTSVAISKCGSFNTLGSLDQTNAENAFDIYKLDKFLNKN